MAQKVWLVGDKNKGISLEDMARKRGRHSWYLKYWLNGKMTRRPEDFPTKTEAIASAKARAQMRWYT